MADLRIADRNDRFRKDLLAATLRPHDGMAVITRGISGLGQEAVLHILRLVAEFGEFTEDNDPYGEHDFGAFDFEHEGDQKKIFWKIDAYDEPPITVGCETASPYLVLTVMLASEY